MASNPQKSKNLEGVPPKMDIAIQRLRSAWNACDVVPARIALGSAFVLLSIIRDTLGNKQEFIELGLVCAEVCESLNRGLNAKKTDDLSESVHQAIEQLRTTVAEIQRVVVKRGKRRVVSGLLNAKGDEDAIAPWKQDLLRILQVFNTELAINTNVMVEGIYRNVAENQGGARLTHFSTPTGESPPVAPRACFGRKELIENVVGLAENLEPIALIGAGGIGKTSIALTVLHHERIEDRFGTNRRFIRCDQFPASRSHFLARLSKVIGAGVENLEDMAPLRSLLSSKEMLIVLDNAESILDPQVTDHKGIYAVVNELCQFETVCVCITSRITTVPRYCKRPKIPTLTMEAACDIFYGIYGNRERFEIIDNLLRRLDFHALSITLLATTASDNAWDYNRLAKEWDVRRAQVLRTDHNESLAATIELSLDSPTFHKLDPNARDLLGVVAFFPQGVDENNLEWLFPTILDINYIFHKFCMLSLAYRNNGFTTILAPIRDYFCPQDPGSSPLLCTIKDRYFTRLLVPLDPQNPAFRESRWIMSEDLNVEHLLDVFTSIGKSSPGVWDACFGFMMHLYWHKPRHTMLRLKIEGLPDAYPSKPDCLYMLSQLFSRVGNHADGKGLLTHLSTLWGDQGNDSQVARTLKRLSTANNLLGLRKEGIQQVKEAMEIHERLGDTVERATCLISLAQLLLDDYQLDAAEDAILHTVDLLPKKGQDLLLCQSHHLLGAIYRSKGEKEKAIDRHETALGIASSFNWRDELVLIHLSLAPLFNNQGKFDDANAHIEQAKSYSVDSSFHLGHAVEVQAQIWCRQHRFEDARSEASCALEIYEKFGETQGVQSCRSLLRRIERAMERRSTR